MKAWHITNGGGIESLTRVELESRPPQPNEVTVRVKASSVNARDLLILSGHHPAPTPEGPFVPISDGAGEVIAAGKDSTFEVGDRVVGSFFGAGGWIDGPFDPNVGLNSSRGAVAEGMLTEEVTVRTDTVIKMPDNLSFEEAASLPCAGGTAWNGVMVKAGLTAGETLLTLGTGGVSMFALQLAKAVGARVVITSSSDEKLARACEAGADITINYRSTPNWAEAVLEATDAHGADVVLDTAGPGTLTQSMGAAAVNGRVVVVGFLADPQATVSPIPLMMRGLALSGAAVGSRRMLEDTLETLASNHIKPVIDQVVDFDDAPAAFRILEEAKHVGKIVILHP